MITTTTFVYTPRKEGRMQQFEVHKMAVAAYNNHKAQNEFPDFLK